MYFNSAPDQQISARVLENRQKLQEWQLCGYGFLTTRDDGETWEGTNQSGIEIRQLLNGVFLGRVRSVDEQVVT